MMKRDSPMKTSSKDYYNLLGVQPDATLAQIKTAYRRLAKQYHPDVNNSPDAAERFREITEAYDTLADPDRRRRYDRLHGTMPAARTPGAGNTGPESPIRALEHAPGTGPRTATARRPPAGS